MQYTAQSEVTLGDQWKGFDLVRVGGQNTALRCYKRGDIIVMSGCITTVVPMKIASKAGWDVDVGAVQAFYQPHIPVFFLAPTMMSRYEGIYQCGTSTTLRSDGKLVINFVKSAVPLVLHLSGLCCLASPSDEDAIPLPMAANESVDWFAQSSKKKKKDEDEIAAPVKKTTGLDASETRPPQLRRADKMIFLEGEMQDATYGPVAQRIGTLPEDLRPKREARWLALLVDEYENSGRERIEQTVAVTLRLDGGVLVQGGKQHMMDSKGNMRLMQQKKRGRLVLDGIRYSLEDGIAVQLHESLTADASLPKEGEAEKKSKLGYLFSGGAAKSVIQAACIKQDDMVFLEGHLCWNSAKVLSPKHVIATLPRGCWPKRRETFFTRGSSDIEERRRVDIDRYGRIFCPEGAPEGRLEITGIVFVAEDDKSYVPDPMEQDVDELKLNYTREAGAANSSFEGHDLLEEFVRRSNCHEWYLVFYDFTRNSTREMLMPLGNVKARGHDRSDPLSIGPHKKLWEHIEKELKSKPSKLFEVGSFHIFMQLSDAMFETVLKECKLDDRKRRALVEHRAAIKKHVCMYREPGMSYAKLQVMADDIIEQMFQHWDFRAQLQGALQNDYKPPTSIQHLFPKKNWSEREMSDKLKTEEERQKFEEIRQFFHLYETTGSNMTHCSLMGSTDTFSTTGKWHFPDSPEVQKQLFENIAWLYPKKIYMYISERQTSRFPYIEDLDIQCKSDWQEWTKDNPMRPPDEMIMFKPQRDNNGEVFGWPGPLMDKRAMAIHRMYPQIKKLHAYVYSASGFNKGKGMLKSSFHLVWPQLIVDADLAPMIRYVTAFDAERTCITCLT
eukprot:TRINITY_DN9485_c0_g1_i3.p1 TRINITY_DN9485_c0_g1~~TRINITY_DN9485_c0_g1_i3.p1  ORF type:complete len:840 (-),score=180.95 TRINITY_DN9485_c0_g1_i3:1539-4058(-)